MLQKIPRNLLQIPGNAIEDSGECSRGFQRMFGKVPENVYSRGRDLFLLYLMKE